MRHFNKIILVVILSALSSCGDDFLNLTPQTSLSSSSFFASKIQFDQALTSAYEPLRAVVHASIFMDEMRSDNAFFTRYSANRGFEPSTESLALFLDDANSAATLNSPGNLYQVDYTGIARVNTILGKLQSAPLTPAEKDEIAGQALFLRAFYYYNLVQHFGKVPLQLDDITSPADAFKPRNSVEEVYGQVVADLQEAIPLLVEATTFPQSGKATKGAAKMLLAYSYMSQSSKNYAGAEAALKDITQMQYDLLPDYADVFDPTNKNNAESIFEVQYFSDLSNGQQSDFAWIFAPKTTNPAFLMGFAGSGMNIFSGWNVPTQEMVDSYEPDDLRLPASIAVVEGTISGVEDFTATDIKSPVDYTPAPGVDYFYMIKKYYHPPYVAEFNAKENFPIFRYSGALLLLAECLVAEGKDGEALPYLNMVRHRAGLPDATTATADNIADEMRHELAFENHRWTDLIRIGKAVEVLNAKGVTMKSLYGWILPNSFNVTTDRLIYPLPARELQINTLLAPQNPGY
jgi:starch-binding outer membrane protein, SusD/RagB family